MNHPIDCDPVVGNGRLPQDTSSDAQLVGQAWRGLLDEKVSSGMTNFFYGEFRTTLKIHFLTMKKMKNSHPHVPHVPQVQPVAQEPQAPFRHGLHQGQNTQRLLRHPLGRKAPCMVSFRTIYAEFRSTCAEFRSILRIQIQTYIILCLITVWRQSEKKIKKTTRSTRCTRSTSTAGRTGVPPLAAVGSNCVRGSLLTL